MPSPLFSQVHNFSIVTHRSSPQNLAIMQELQQPARCGLPPAASGKFNLAACVQRRQDFVLRQIVGVDVTAGVISGLARYLCEGLISEVVVGGFRCRIGADLIPSPRRIGRPAELVERPDQGDAARRR